MIMKRTFAQYICACVLIFSSIILAFIEAISTHNIASGILLYIAQAFLLAASIFGLDYYVRKITDYVKNNEELHIGRNDAHERATSEQS